MRRVFVVVSLMSISTILMAAPMPALAAWQGAAASAAPAGTADASGVDTIVDLVKGGMPESLVLKTIQKNGKPYDLGPADLLKLQKAGVSQKVIETMMDPSSATPGSASPAPAGAAAAVASPPASAAPAAAKTNGKAADKTADKATEKKSGGMFSSLKDKLKDSAQKTVDGVGDTTASAVDKSVNTGQAKLDDAIPSVDDKKATTAAKSTATTATTTKK